MEHAGARRVAVIMQRLPLDNRWQPWQWRPLEIVELDVSPLPDEPGPRCLMDSAEESRWLFGGFELEFFRDEAEGYFLNVDTANPSWFVMWRMEEVDGQEIAVPKSVTLSYNVAARLMDGGERVDILPASPHIVELMHGFVAQYYRPEVKGKRRKPSFEGGAAVQEMARAEKDVPRGG
ncbi:DUF3305 domain-containing protein [Lacisediminimonas sp.]|uniref:DUF3305 domain-containing protein n=1 Tax=Lacisediminimonas sp. TaxID=3060582 RepID=UPI0027202EFF|nr:DUF3305 domain-containing protein [Lacisediminimonas sp.]MDO8298443.1 DUF3305 domain-containing protein [Lacisediminimonas sp.]